MSEADAATLAAIYRLETAINLKFEQRAQEVGEQNRRLYLKLDEHATEMRLSFKEINQKLHEQAMATNTLRSDLNSHLEADEREFGALKEHAKDSMTRKHGYIYGFYAAILSAIAGWLARTFSNGGPQS